MDEKGGRGKGSEVTSWKFIKQSANGEIIENTDNSMENSVNSIQKVKISCDFE